MPHSPALTCVVSPNPTDAGLTLKLLADSGVTARAFGGVRELAAALGEEVACLVLVEDALIEEDLPALREALERLPHWMDLPLIVVARDVGLFGETFANAFPESGNVTFLERPLNPHTLISAVRVALRASARQRQVAQLLTEREEAVKLRDEFLAMLAHELRNPLAPMRNAVYLMRMLKLEDRRAVKHTEMLERQINHMVRMVDDLMDVARLERSKMVLKTERADLNRIVGAAVESSLPNARARGHRISVHYDASELPVIADVVRIEQVVCNLINNAAKFTLRPDEIRVETRAENGAAVVTVEDRGAGFEPAAAEKLFAPFLQAAQSIERSAGGLGLGLTIVKRLAELHGGSAQAASAGPGKGARFSVRIPLATGAPADVAPAEPAPLSGPRRRVVVVEDNADIRESLGIMLELWGHEVTMAGDGIAGVEEVIAREPDVALIDVGLPGMNGYQVARAIREKLKDRVRLVAVTGYGQPSDRQQAMEAGFDTHLLKPIAPELLERLLADGG